LLRENEKKGKILILMKIKGKENIASELDCEKMVSLLKYCNGFEINAYSKIEVFSFRGKFVIIYNDMIIFTLKLKDLFEKFGDKNLNTNTNTNKDKDNNNNNSNSKDKDNEFIDPWIYSSRFLLGINNQKNFELHELEIKNLGLNDIKLFQKEVNDMKNYAHGKDHEYKKLNDLIKDKKMYNY
jgi:hypothetical protein